MLKIAGAAVVLAPMAAPKFAEAYASSGVTAPRAGTLKLAVARRSASGAYAIKTVSIPAIVCSATTRRTVWACGACAGCRDAAA